MRYLVTFIQAGERAVVQVEAPNAATAVTAAIPAPRPTREPAELLSVVVDPARTLPEAKV